MAQIIISESELEDYKKTAVKWSPTLLDLPVRTAMDVLKYMYGVNKLRGKQKLPSVSADSQIAPFKKNRSGSAQVNIDFRELETFLGNSVEEFAPVDYAAYTMGYDDPIAGEAIKGASTTALVLFQLAKARGQHIAEAVLLGVRNPSGDRTIDLCDGLLTIAGKEITAGKISADAGNYFKLQDQMTFANACDLLKEDVVFRINPFLRAQNNLLLCDPLVADMYNESYLATHQSVSYNDAYSQPYLEGSNRKITIVGLPELAGQKRMILTQKENMWWGTDNANDEKAVDIMRKDHYTLSFATNMWLGAQFRSIDPRCLAIIELADYAAKPDAGGSTTTTDPEKQ